MEGKADLVIAAAGVIPKGFLGEPIWNTTLVLVCAAGHALTQITDLDADELSQHLQM